MSVARDVSGQLLEAARTYPVVTVTGPRQSGKTTLCRMLFPDRPWLNLERPDVRDRAVGDPAAFVSEHAGGAIFDEVQRAPELLSWIQDAVDRDPSPGRFVLTGSVNLALHEAVTQSLAGRTAIMTVLPLHLDEIRRFDRPLPDLATALVTGGYPRIHDAGLVPDAWLADYVATYVERDVRHLRQVGDLRTFRTFLSLCAGRTAQELNLSALASDAGVDHKTARAWISVLEASWLVFLVSPWARTHRKRLTKTPKLYFWDSGLAAWLLGLREPAHLHAHPLRGPLFETWVVSEIAKRRLARTRDLPLWFYREHRGLEVDGLLETGRGPVAFEVKSTSTFSPHLATRLERFASLLHDLAGAAPEPASLRLVLGGGDSRFRVRDVEVLPWDRLGEVEW